MRGFPTALLRLLRCPHDGGALALDGAPAQVETADVACAACRGRFPIRDGILDLLRDEQPRDAESRFELEARAIEARASRGAPAYALSFADHLEIAGTMRRLHDVDGGFLLELGAGAGTFTRPLARRCAGIVAIDFSLNHLLLNREQLEDADRVALVRADVTHLGLAEAAFDSAFTTLYSNLPSAAHRGAMNAAVERALRPDGVYLVSAHHQELRRRLRRRPASDRYVGSNIFFHAFTHAELREELKAFPAVATSTTALLLPVLARLERARWLSELAEAVPLVSSLGGTLLARARKAPAPQAPAPRGPVA